jgi:monovalent cation:H+ antiporter, CPA1 family
MYLLHATAVTPGLTMDLLLILLGIAAVVAFGTRWVKVPYTLVLVLVGLCLGFFKLVTPVALTEHLVLFTLLPILLFEAAWHLRVADLARYGWLVFLLSTFGVVFSIGFIGVIVHSVLHVPLLVSLLFGAIVAPTDPVSVVALMKMLKLDRGLETLIEGESLCNDATSVVFFKLLVAVIMVHGANATASLLQAYAVSAVVQFTMVLVGGILTGGLIGLCFGWISRLSNEKPFLMMLFTTLAAYGAFWLAECIPIPGQIPNLHLSGIISTVTAGLTLGTLSRTTGIASSTHLMISSFWEYAAFLVNSVIFLLLGLTLQGVSWIQHAIPLVVAITTTLLARGLMVYGFTMLFNAMWGKKQPQDRLSATWQHIMVWSGLRGALSLTLVMSIPAGIIGGQYVDLLLVMVSGVVLQTLLVQGGTFAGVLKFLKVNPATEEYPLDVEKDML